MIELHDEAIIAAHNAMEPVKVTAKRLGVGHDTIQRRRRHLGLCTEGQGRKRQTPWDVDGLISPIPGCKACGLRDFPVGNKPLVPHECLEKSLAAVGTRGLGGWVL